MSSNDRRGTRSKSDQETAAYMKKHNIRRTTGACPMHCGAQVSIGGQGLLAHLGACRGAKRG